MEFNQRNSAFTNLRRFMQPRGRDLEKCELCGEHIAGDHQHLIEPESRKLVCSCDACSILFSNKEGKYRRVPRTVRFLESFQLSDQQWDSLLIPINMAFFFYSSPAEKTVALYPSPAGPTESLLSLEAWEEISVANPILQKMEEDTEALLVNRVNPKDAQFFIAPIDKCFELTGLIRAHWKGLSGGAEVWQAIERFFTELKEQAGNR